MYTFMVHTIVTVAFLWIVAAIWNSIVESFSPHARLTPEEARERIYQAEFRAWFESDTNEPCPRR